MWPGSPPPARRPARLGLDKKGAGERLGCRSSWAVRRGACCCTVLAPADTPAHTVHCSGWPPQLRGSWAAGRPAVAEAGGICNAASRWACCRNFGTPAHSQTQTGMPTRRSSQHSQQLQAPPHAATACLVCQRQPELDLAAQLGEGALLIQRLLQQPRGSGILAALICSTRTWQGGNRLS